MRTATLLIGVGALASACQWTDPDGADHPRPALPLALSETGLHADDVHEFTPRFELWSDGLVKRRWIGLPPDGAIDSSDLDDWVFPAGTRLWKELSLDGRRLETRMLVKVGDQPGAWRMAAYVWDEDQAEAWLAEAGEDDVLGSEHDVPGATTCLACHGAARDRVLGFSAIQLHGEPARGLAPLVADGRFSTPLLPSAEVPGDATTRAALGYLHANCGSCHRPGGGLRIGLDLSLRVDALDDVGATGAYVTAVDVHPSAADDGGEALVAPGRPDRSSVYRRMAARGTELAMPPVGSRLVDPAGLAVVEAWIAGLPTDGALP